MDISVTKEVLVEHFSKYLGKENVISANIIINMITKLSKGYGFVKLVNESIYKRAIDEMSGTTLMGKSIVVKEGFQRKKVDDFSRRRMGRYHQPSVHPYSMVMNNRVPPNLQPGVSYHYNPYQ